MRRLPLLVGAKRPLIFAHRGCSLRAPENTMASFRLAQAEGIPGIELDVHLSVDGKLAVIHDHYSGRVAPGGPRGPDGRGLEIERSGWNELRSLDVGSWKGGEWRAERIPLLPELLEELGQEEYFDIELKNRIGPDYGLEAAVATCLHAFSSSRGMKDRLIVSSFNPLSLARFKALAPEIPTALIWSSDSGIPPYLRHGEGRWIAGPDLLKPEKAKVNRFASLRWRHLGGYPVLPWTIDDATEAARLLKLGCEGIISNDPGSLGLELNIVELKYA